MTTPPVYDKTSNPWLQVLKVCGIHTAQLRTDLKQGEQNRILEDFNSPDGKIQVLICSYRVSCAGLNLQKHCRTSIEYEPPPNESVRTQELGRVRRRGQPSPWVRHITLLTKDTLNTKQDSEAILKNLPSLITQLNMDIWGKGDEQDNSYKLGDFVLHEGKLCPVKDPKVSKLKLAPLDPDELLVQIQIQLLGRKADTTGEALRKHANTDLSVKRPKVSAKAGTEIAAPSAKVEFPEEPLWT